MPGFITEDGYAAVPFCKSLMILFNGEQLDVVKTKRQAEQYIQQHRDSLKTVTPKNSKPIPAARVKRKTK